MAMLVSMQQAKEHLHITVDDTDADVALKIEHASFVVLDYLKTRANWSWTEQDAPGHVQAAVLLVLGHLYEHRGDDMRTDDALWGAIGRLLARARDPAYA
jgi:Phage gp6-like head-tail connector protein